MLSLNKSYQKKEKTNSGYKHNNKVSNGIFNLTFRMLQHTSSEVMVTKSDEISKDNKWFETTQKFSCEQSQ